MANFLQIYEDKIRLTYKKESVPVNWTTFSGVFTKNTWLIWSAIVITLTFFFTVFSRLAAPPTDKKVFHDWLLSGLVIALSSSGDLFISEAVDKRLEPRRHFRVLLMTTLVFGVLIYNFYVGAIISNLITKEKYTEIDSLDQV